MCRHCRYDARADELEMLLLLATSETDNERIVKAYELVKEINGK